MAFTDNNQTVSVGEASRVYYDINDKDPKLGHGRHRRAEITDGAADLYVTHRDDKGAVARDEIKFVDVTQNPDNIKNQEQVTIAVTYERGDADAKARALALYKAALTFALGTGNPEAFLLGLS